MTWLVVILIAIAQIGLWRRQRRLERERTATTVALTRFVDAQISLDASHGEALAGIPQLVEKEIRRVIREQEKHAPVAPTLFPN